MQPFLFATLYLGYKYIHPRSSSVDLRDLTVEDYVLEDLSTIELEGPSAIPPVQFHLVDAHEMASPVDGIAESSSKAGQPYASVEVSQEYHEESGVQNAARQERERIAQILRRRPRRLERGVWREIWSFVVADKE